MIIDKQGKIWGTTTKIYSNDAISVHYLHIKKGGYCSEHQHKSKVNFFYVISGVLEVSTLNGNIEDKTELQSGSTMTVQQGVIHKFQAKTEVHCIEIYQVFLNENDIERISQGGIKK